MKIQITQRLLDEYPHAKFAAVLAQNFENSEKNILLEKERAKVYNFIKKIKEVSSIKQISEHKIFHDKFGKSYPIEFQVNSIKQGKIIPIQSTLKDVLFISEMKHYCIISGHDVKSTHSDLKFDLSKRGESYTKISGKHQELKLKDIVLRENERVITSLLYGPDDSTKIVPSTTNCLYLFWFSSFISKAELDSILEDFKKSLKNISSSNSKIMDMDIGLSLNEESIVTPWEVKGNIDYDKLIIEFGVKPIDEKLLHRLKSHTGDLHHFLSRKIFFAHTYLDIVLDAHEKGHKFYLYTGRAPSGPVHLGHIVPWVFCKWLQDKFDVTLLFQIPDEEKFLFKEGVSLGDAKKWSHENILDIIALGFDPKKTKIFLDTEYANTMYPIACEVAKKTTASTAKALFGLQNDDNVGKYFYSCMQSVPAFLPTKFEKKPTNVLIPCAIDQDVHFRLTRDVAPKLGYPKPSTILCRFLPALEGGGKLSTSSGVSIFTTDDVKTVEKKINKYAFSGGKDTLEQHRKEGGNPDVDICYQYLTYFLEDEKRLNQIHDDYKKGKLLSGELKKITIDEINKFLKEHQHKREKAKAHVEKFMLRD